MFLKSYNSYDACMDVNFSSMSIPPNASLVYVLILPEIMSPNIRKGAYGGISENLSYGSTFVAQNFNLLLTQVSFLYVCPLPSYKGKHAEDITA